MVPDYRVYIVCWYRHQFESGSTNGLCEAAIDTLSYRCRNLLISLTIVTQGLHTNPVLVKFQAPSRIYGQGYQLLQFSR
jgi:hypothetical protein